MSNLAEAQSSEQYDQHWKNWPDFVKYHPGSRHRRRLLMNFINNLKFQSVLDVGCGTGELLSLLQAQYGNSIKLTGADYSAHVNKENKKKFPNVDFYEIDLTKSHLNKTFDLVLCSEVIEHLKEQKEAFANLSKMVNQGGHLCLTCPTGKIFATEAHFGHLHHPTREELESYAAENKMVVKEFLVWGWPLYNTLKHLTNVNTDWALKNFAEGSYSPWKKFIATVLYFFNFFNLPTSPFGSQIVVVFQKT